MMGRRTSLRPFWGYVVEVVSSASREVCRSALAISLRDKGRCVRVQGVQ